MKKRITDMGLSETCFELVSAVLGASKVARQVRLDAAKSGTSGFARLKEDQTWQTKGDVASQGYIMRKLGRRFPKSRFLPEEKCLDRKFMSSCLAVEELPSLFTLERVWIVDGIDFTRAYLWGMPGWSVSVQGMQRGMADVSAVLAPQDLDGFLVVAEQGVGTFFSQGRSGFKKAKLRAWNGTSKPAVLYGLPIVSDPSYDAFWQELRTESEHQEQISCALGLALVACGRAHAYVHGILPAYDWAGGSLLVDLAERPDDVATAQAKAEKPMGEFPVVQWYGVVNGLITAVKSPPPLSYDPHKPHTGFIAGHPAVVSKLFTMLQRQYHEKVLRVGSVIM